jgi:hypothetical protein
LNRTLERQQIIYNPETAFLEISDCFWRVADDLKIGTQVWWRLDCCCADDGCCAGV